MWIADDQLEVYSSQRNDLRKRNRSASELIAAIRSDELAFFRNFSQACLLELREYAAY